MRILLKVWLPVLAVVAFVALIYLVANWSILSATHKLSFAVAIMIVLHMFEEERFPGGFGYMFNVIRADSDVPDRYPMSPLIAMLVDVGVFVVLFVPALIFPRFLWLGMAPMFLAMLELVMHGGVIGVFLQWRRRGLSIYNPGLVTATLLAAIGISYVVVLTTGSLMSGLDWLWAVLFFVGTILVCLVLPEFGLRSKTTRWGYDHEHYLGFYKRYTTIEDLFGGETTPATA